MSRAARDRFARSPWVARSGTRRPSRDSWTGSCAEARAAELARLDETHEERVELVVLLVASRPEAGHGLSTEAPEHLEPAPENTHPLLGEVLGEDAREAGAREVHAIAVPALDGHRGHPLLQSPPLVERQARSGDPVAEGQASSRPEHTGALIEDACLVGNVQQPFLADHGREGGAREGKRLGIGADHTHEAAESDERGETSRAGRALGREIDAGDAGRAPGGDEAGRACQPRADVEHAALRRDAGPARKGLHRGQSTVVILVPLVEVFGGKLSQVLALAAQCVEHLLFADRMLPVEEFRGGDDVSHGGKCTSSACVRETGTRRLEPGRGLWYYRGRFYPVLRGDQARHE